MFDVSGVSAARARATAHPMAHGVAVGDSAHRPERPRALDLHAGGLWAVCTLDDYLLYDIY